MGKGSQAGDPQTGDSQNIPSVQKILDQKKKFDQRLGEIADLSGEEIDVILSVDGADFSTMTSSDAAIYAAFLKDGRVSELQKAEKWLRYNQAAYLSLAGRLPPEVWESRAANKTYLDVLSWIAEQPEEEWEALLALPLGEALREMEKSKRSSP